MIDSIGYLLWGIAFGFALSAPVGPVNIICLQRSLFGRARDGFMIGTGAALGDAFYAGLAALGLKAFLSLISSYDVEMKIFGALVMVVFAVRIWRSRPHIDREPQSGGVKRGMIGALALTVMNPGIFVGFISLYALAGIGDLGAGSGHPHSDAISLVLGVFAGSCLWWLVLVWIGRFLRDRVNDQLLSIINHVSAGVIGLFAFGALVSIWLQ